jgi:predicted Rossmann fold nucleotide-binding protein DprA/Smf involved in DNA uptake
MSATTLELQTICPDEAVYPVALKTCAAFKTVPTLTEIGNLDLLSQNPIALFCSIKCPGDLILKTYDLAQALRDAEIPVISGFHTPIEQDSVDRKVSLFRDDLLVHLSGFERVKLKNLPGCII